MPKTLADMTDAEVKAWRRSLMAAGKRPKKNKLVDKKTESRYSYREGFGTVEIQPNGDEYLAQYIGGELRRTPLPTSSAP